MLFLRYFYTGFMLVLIIFFRFLIDFILFCRILMNVEKWLKMAKNTRKWGEYREPKKPVLNSKKTGPGSKGKRKQPNRSKKNPVRTDRFKQNRFSALSNPPFFRVCLLLLPYSSASLTPETEPQTLDFVALFSP